MLDHKCFHYVGAPVLNMRKEPHQKSEMVSQALFSERVEILEESDDWVYIATTVDGYKGWTNQEGITSRKETFLSSADQVYVTVKRLAAHLYDAEDTIYGPAMTLPFESRLAILDSPETVKHGTGRWLRVELPDGRQGWIQRGDVRIGVTGLNLEEVCRFSHQFIGLPYTWGGRSSFGYDCSGFVQMLYRQMGISLPRDSKQQFLWKGFKPVDVTNVDAGDLVFYGFDQERICHVGFCLGDGKFIHTSAVSENAPYLRVSSLHDPEWNGSGYYPYLNGRALQQLS